MPESLVFRKSSHSTARGQDCVEVADTSTRAAVRDSKHPDAHLEFSLGEWTALLIAARRNLL